MEVNIYIGFWTLKVKCTQHGICGEVAFKNARANMRFTPIVDVSSNIKGSIEINIGSWTMQNPIVHLSNKPNKQ